MTRNRVRHRIKSEPVPFPQRSPQTTLLVRRLDWASRADYVVLATGWGYRRIIGELRKLRLRIGRPSVRRILKDEGLTPSPTRRGRAEETVWRKFIRLHVNTLVACDFFTKSVITSLGARLSAAMAARSPSTARQKKTTARTTPIAAPQFGLGEAES